MCPAYRSALQFTPSNISQKKPSALYLEMAYGVDIIGTLRQINYPSARQ